MSRTTSEFAVNKGGVLEKWRTVPAGSQDRRSNGPAPLIQGVPCWPVGRSTGTFVLGPASIPYELNKSKTFLFLLVTFLDALIYKLLDWLRKNSTFCQFILGTSYWICVYLFFFIFWNRFVNCLLNVYNRSFKINMLRDLAKTNLFQALLDNMLYANKLTVVLANFFRR